MGRDRWADIDIQIHKHSKAKMVYHSSVQQCLSVRGCWSLVVVGYSGCDGQLMTTINTHILLPIVQSCWEGSLEWQHLASRLSSRNSFVPVLSRPCKFKSVETRESNEMPACILPSQNTLVSSNNFLHQAKNICSQAKSSARKHSWNYPYKSKYLLTLSKGMLLNVKLSTKCYWVSCWFEKICSVPVLHSFLSGQK